MRLRGKLGLFAAAVAASMGLASPASATNIYPFEDLGQAVAEAITSFTLYSQGQIGLAGTVQDFRSPGGISLRSSITFYGLGLAAALRYERIGGRHGGVFALGGQLRPLGLLENRLYRRLDPFVSLGGEIGGDEASVRGSGVVGVGCDLALFDRKDGPALTLEYQIRPLRYPDDTPLHLLHVGAAFRSVF